MKLPRGADGVSINARDAPDPLTPREAEVFALLMQGKKLREIAEALGIKFSTVNTHQKSIYKKLGVNTRAECFVRFGGIYLNPHSRRDFNESEK